MTASIKNYVQFALMQLTGHENAGPSADPNTEAMVDALLDFTVSKDLVVDAAANTNAIAAHFEKMPPVSSVLKEAGIVPDATLALDASDYVTVTFEVEDGAGGGKTTLGTISTAAANWAVGVPVTATLTATTVPASGVISVKSVKSNAGVAQPVRTAYCRLRLNEV